MISRRRIASFGILLRPVIAVTLWLTPAPDHLAAQQVSFSRDVLPILSENCFMCHGPEDASRKGELRLDTPNGAARVLSVPDTGPAELIARITSSDPDLHMPPSDSNRRLQPLQVEILQRWIAQGAKWELHWSFEPLTKPAVPASHSEDVPPQNEIDHFVRSRLQREGLTPSAEADRRTLIRRATLDLTGLPPTVAEVRDYLEDTSPDAWERVVDRLLQDSAFGERMAWDWLDAARYADSNGYQGDNERTMWPWRDWVVEAFNRNLPFDQFTMWQLAGDLLPDATFEQQLATGFCRNHMINGEGGRIPDENRVDYVMDMSETMGTVWLGLTLNCCRCHDHKFDPLTQKNYYEFFAFFNQTPVDGGGRDAQTPPVLAAPTHDQRQRQNALAESLTPIRNQLTERAKQLQPEQPAWEASRLKAAVAPVSGDKTHPADDAEVLAALRIPSQDRSKEQNQLVQNAFLLQDTEYAALVKERDQKVQEEKTLRSQIPKVMVMADRETPRTTFVLERGLYNQPTEAEVRPSFPQSLPGAAHADPDDAARGAERASVSEPNRPASETAAHTRLLSRLDLAQWLVSDKQPLTARVTVNRFWQQLFGIGLVRTSEDFGIQGEYPVHHNLLDWLACDFRDSGWNVKRLMKTILMSHTYRQSSRNRETLRTDDTGRPLFLSDVDPENRLLARASRYRLPSWMLRDQALAVSGLINRTIGGPPVNTYQPEGVWEEATFGNKKYRQDTGDALYRRSLYIFWRRIIGPTMFFDNAPRQTCVVKVLRTNTPLHALLTLNETTYLEAARTLAQRALMEASAASDSDRLAVTFETVLSRMPRAEETDVLLAGLDRSRRHYADHVEEAVQLLSVGESARDTTLNSADHAAWTNLCLALLNLDETLNRE